MKTKPRSKADPIKRQIESVFQPGTFIRDRDWVERGRALDHERQFRSTAAYDLDTLHLELLSKLGRAVKALAAAWTDFRKHPSKFTSVFHREARRIGNTSGLLAGDRPPPDLRDPINHQSGLVTSCLGE